ncbi:D-ribose pyranase [Arthrobacter sp. JUb115]|uniref:D-ribose pyranase n=1 Tax=Arthrobacter sp. JUb115 TaxID=2485108 RepID=UPI001060BEB6|nr:D-ribose pyranase [Arthrobacter sp. JUb115]TDU25970.1 ribose transport protein RbsD [Arthrobacter sp. JUb115]
MLKSEILNAPLLAALAKCGHTDIVVIADCGLPLPEGPLVIDLALVQGLPSLDQVLEVLARNMVIENSTLAAEAENGPVQELCLARDLDPDFISHEELKAQLPQAKVIVRTGEATPYANAILHCGVAF